MERGRGGKGGGRREGRKERGKGGGREERTVPPRSVNPGYGPAVIVKIKASVFL